VIDCVRAVGG